MARKQQCTPRDVSAIGRVEESSHARILFAYKLARPVLTIARCNLTAIEAIAEISARTFDYREMAK